MTTKAATSQVVALFMDGLLTDGKQSLLCCIWFTLFQNAFNKDKARPWLQVSVRGRLFGGNSPPANTAALPGQYKSEQYFSVGGKSFFWIISPINPPAFVIPESSSPVAICTQRRGMAERLPVRILCFITN